MHNTDVPLLRTTFSKISDILAQYRAQTDVLSARPNSKIMIIIIATIQISSSVKMSKLH